MVKLISNPRRWSLFGILAVLALAGCGPVGEGEAGEEASQATVEDESEYLDDPPGTTTDPLYGCYQCTNCVKYARCRQPKLPYGLTYWSDKTRIINNWNNPRAGCVAMIKTSSIYGHVAYVRAVSGSTIYIDEGNWPRGVCGKRYGTKSRLNIAGFWCPR